MKNKTNNSLFFVIIVFLGLLIFMFYQTKTNINIMNNDNNIYFYSVEDENIKNETLLDYFVENARNELTCSLLMRINEAQDEHIIEYGILYEDNIYVVYSAIDGIVQSETRFNYLINVKYNDYDYFFLSNIKEVLIEDVEEYFNGNCFDLFELGRKKVI